MTKKTSLFVAALLLLIFLLLCVTSAFSESLTFDEIVHLQEGKNAILKHQFVIDTNNPPLIRELAVTPLVLGVNKFIPSRAPNVQAFPARTVIILLGSLLGFLLYYVSGQLLGWDVGIFALFLYVFEPDILAHSHYVTQDIGVTLFFFLTYVLFIQLLQKPKTRNFILFGLSAGLMAASKINGVVFFAISGLWASIVVLRNSLGRWLRRYWGLKLLTICLVSVTVWATYFFKSNVIVASGGAQDRVSSRLTSYAKVHHLSLVTAGLNFLKTTPVPLGDYIAVMKNTVIRSTKPENIFFMGAFYTKNRWYFMPVNLVLKLPIPLLIFFALGTIVSASDGKRRKVIFLYGVPVATIIGLSLVLSLQGLVRYILPVYPFIILLAASVITYIRTPLQRVILFILCLWYVIGTLAVAPHYLSYANEFAGHGMSKNLILADSNMDWGQSLITFERYIAAVKPSKLTFSYFGRDNASAYGLKSDFPFGSYKFNEICAFHDVSLSKANSGRVITAISLSNWYACGYNLDPKYSKNMVKSVVGNTILIY